MSGALRHVQPTPINGHYRVIHACLECSDSGVLLARDRNNPNAGVTAFRCRCSTGDRDRRPYPQWNSSIETAFDRGAA